MPNPKLYFSADYHFNHVNVLKYDNRPFKTIEEHNIGIIYNHNQMVNKEDVCIVVGDVYFRGGREGGKTHYYEFLKQMNGRITIIRGNHDSKSNKIIDPIQSASMYVSGLKIFCVHDPINSKVEYDLNLVAHVHNAWKMAELHEKNKVSLLINVGVTQWNYRPVAFTKLFELYTQWKVGKIKAGIYDKEAVKEYRANRRKK